MVQSLCTSVAAEEDAESEEEEQKDAKLLCLESDLLLEVVTRFHR